MTAMTDELRRRLDVPVDIVSDSLLDTTLAVATNDISPWLAPVTLEPNPLQPNIDEAVLQLAVKIWDISNRGINSQTPQAIGFRFHRLQLLDWSAAFSVSSVLPSTWVG